MAVFNTNLANVNSILVNESLNLTHEEKVKVINEFKKVNSINESQEKYKTLVQPAYLIFLLTSNAKPPAESRRSILIGRR